MNMRLLRDEALSIWTAGVDAVRSDRLVQAHVEVVKDQLRIADRYWPLSALRHIEVVGAGKAGAGMAQGLEHALGPRVMRQTQLSGWLNVPEDCVRPLSRIHLHPARPAGVNEPTQAGIEGATEIVRRVRSLGASDLCICLISGGGSALLPAPCDGITLDDLLTVTRVMSVAGATIQQLNAVRKRLSQIQGGRLAGHCRSGQLVTLIISDVIGDPLDVIASGPTVVDPEPRSAARFALEVVRKFEVDGITFPAAVRDRLARDADAEVSANVSTEVVNLVIGNNQTAVEAAQQAALGHGFTTEIAAAQPAEMSAETVGRSLVESLRVRSRDPQPTQPHCLISGGEPVVTLTHAADRGRGGRNQQLVLAAVTELWSPTDSGWPLADQVLLSGGTDGEDGPTDAAGALVDQHVWQRMRQQRLDPQDYLRRNDAYTFFEATDGLIRTGPTHTNVCDLRIACSRPETS